MLGRLRARIGYRFARLLLRWRWTTQQPRLWQWMQGQFARMAALDDVGAQSFYGHILLFRGQGLGARQEGKRLLRKAAEAGDAKSAYQLGVLSLSGDLDEPQDAAKAAHWWQHAAGLGHPLAASRLVQLYKSGATGLPADPILAEQYAQRAQALGL